MGVSSGGANSSKDSNGSSGNRHRRNGDFSSSSSSTTTTNTRPNASVSPANGGNDGEGGSMMRDPARAEYDYAAKPWSRSMEVRSNEVEFMLRRPVESDEDIQYTLAAAEVSLLC